MPNGCKPPQANATDPALDLVPFLDAVRTNCHISDARHAGDYTLCIYLLKMREYFRWEKAIPYGEPLPQAELADWLTQRESQWDALEARAFEPVPVDGTCYDPFDSAAINNAINSKGYIYSSGYGRNMKPVFFLGELEKQEQQGSYSLLVSGRELARDLAAPPAMSRDKTIFVRRESLRRMLWEKVEEWRWNKPDNAMKTALEYFDFDTDADNSLDALTDTTLDTVILHEIGEVKAGEILGPAWQDMLVTLGNCRAEIMSRAVRDHLADALSTLPGLVKQADPAALHFYMAHLSGMSKELFPQLVSAYEIWSVTGELREIEQLIDRAANHWQTLTENILAIFKREQTACQKALIREIESHTL